MSNVEGNLVKVCPACGFSFKNFNYDPIKKTKKCPKCGYEFSEPYIQPEKNNFYPKRI